MILTSKYDSVTPTHGLVNHRKNEENIQKTSITLSAASWKRQKKYSFLKLWKKLWLIEDQTEDNPAEIERMEKNFLDKVTVMPDFKYYDDARKWLESDEKDIK